jgi:hypothetical protein
LQGGGYDLGLGSQAAVENAQAVLAQTDAYLREDMGIDAETPSHKRRNRGNRLEEFIKAEEQDMSGK